MFFVYNHTTIFLACLGVLIVYEFFFNFIVFVLVTDLKFLFQSESHFFVINHYQRIVVGKIAQGCLSLNVPVAFSKLNNSLI